MRQSSDLQPQPVALRAILRAKDLARLSSARLGRIANRAGGDDGLALAGRLVGMILADEPPDRWPISTMIDLLEVGDAGPDRQADRLLADLRSIEADLLSVSDGEAASSERAA